MQRLLLPSACVRRKPLLCQRLLLPTTPSLLVLPGAGGPAVERPGAACGRPRGAGRGIQAPAGKAAEQSLGKTSWGGRGKAACSGGEVTALRLGKKLTARSRSYVVIQLEPALQAELPFKALRACVLERSNFSGVVFFKINFWSYFLCPSTLCNTE